MTMYLKFTCTYELYRVTGHNKRCRKQPFKEWVKKVRSLVGRRVFSFCPVPPTPQIKDSV